MVEHNKNTNKIPQEILNMYQKTKYIQPYLFIFPAIFYLSCLVFYPFFDTIRLSMTDAKLNSAGAFIGLENYKNLLGDKRFWQTITRTFTWTFLVVFLKMNIGLLGALLLSTAAPGVKYLKTFVLPPWIIPLTIGTIFWGWMYNSEYGIFNVWLQHFGLVSSPINFLGDGTFAFYATAAADTWVGVPMVALFLLTAIQSIPSDMHEAAWVDGAGRFQRFRHITIPQIAPVMATVTPLITIFTFISFDVIWVLTEGGPRKATTTMIIDTYKVALRRFKFGEGATRAVLICLILGLLIMAYFLILKAIDKQKEREKT